MKHIILILSPFILIPMFSLNNIAYGAFDTNGKYYCDPTNLNLEKTIYAAAVSKLNNAIDNYLSLMQDHITQEIYDFIAHSSSGTAEPPLI